MRLTALTVIHKYIRAQMFEVSEILSTPREWAAIEAALPAPRVG